jgi:hypothetical protein
MEKENNKNILKFNAIVECFFRVKKNWITTNNEFNMENNKSIIHVILTGG